MGLKEIARMTGLSITTVSHALNGTRTVSQKSMALIRDAVAKTGYRPNGAAQALKTQRTNMIALIIPSTEPNNSTNCFFFDVLGGVKQTLQEQGYDLIVSTYSENDPHFLLGGIPVLQKNWIDGVLFVPGSRRRAECLTGVDVPVVLIDRRLDGVSLPFVGSDNEQAAVRAIELLAQSGRRRIGYIGGTLDFSSAYDRYRGYQKALAALGLAHDFSLIAYELDYSLESARNAARSLVRYGADAIFAANSVLTMGVVQYLNEQGIRIPEQIALVGFDDYDWTQIVSPPITAVRQDARGMGALGARMLIELLAGNTPDPAAVVLPSALAVRQSHGGTRGPDTL